MKYFVADRLWFRSPRRYVICKGYRDSERLVAEYLMSVNGDLNECKDTDKDIASAVPLDILLEDAEFCDYLTKSNERWAPCSRRGLLE